MEYLQYKMKNLYIFNTTIIVLNLVISGIPSIQKRISWKQNKWGSFKPCYKWNTFNTKKSNERFERCFSVLNLVISGIPSIPLKVFCDAENKNVLNLVISGIPSILG